MNADILLSLATQLQRVLRPLEKSLSNPEAFSQLLRRMGHDIAPAELELESIKESLAISDDLLKFAKILGEIGNATGVLPLDRVVKASECVGRVVTRLSRLSATPAPTGIPAAAWADLGAYLFGELLADYIEKFRPILYAGLLAVGVVDEGSLGEAGIRQLVWNRLPKVFLDFSELMDEVYAWKSPAAFRYDRATHVLNRIARLLGLASAVQAPAADLLDFYYDAANPTRALVRQLVVPVLDARDADDNYCRVLTQLLPIPVGDKGAPPAGLLLQVITASSPQVPAFCPPPFDIRFTGDALNCHLPVEVTPSTTRIAPLPEASAAINAGVQLAACARNQVLLGSRFSSCLQVDTWTLGLRVSGSLVDPELSIELGLEDASLIISEKDGDGFLRDVLPLKGAAFPFKLSIVWSSRTGVRLGNTAFEAVLPIDKALGPLRVRTIAIGIEPTPVSLEAYAALTVDLRIGPIQAAVDRIGLLIRSSPVPPGAPRGSFGDLDVAVGFKPPRGVAFAISGGAVSGGGYLYFDPAKGRYAGVLALSIQKQIQFKAIGLIATSLPEGKPGFSLLFSITADFPPIQLGYGFTLNGVGGLAAFNRTMNLDALRDGIKNRTLDSILFPPDPIANASKIISDLQSVFPAAPDRFVFAPMVKIAWGQSILLIEIGLAVELPSPLRLAIMGKVHLLLPPTDAAKTSSSAPPDKVVEIHMDVLGILDLDRNEISVDAVLYDSRLAIFPITGGMALRIKWGAEPVFLLAVGGFNPRFTPPPDFPALDRVGIQLTYNKDGVRAGLCLTSYMAITASTAQFGARIDAYAETSLAKIAGYLGFDALIEMAPFHVIVDLYGGVTVHAFGLGFSCDILLTLAAFDPVTGNGHVTIDFFGKHEVPIHFEIGEAKPLPALPVVDPMDELVAALSDLRNWSAALPASRSMLVTLRQPTADEAKAAAGQVLAHPLGELSVRQKVLPFGIGLDRFGAAVAASKGPFGITAMTLGAQGGIVPGASTVLRDAFARGQFFNLSEDDKLTGPQFESFECGHSRIGTDKAWVGAHQAVAFEYEVQVIDSLAEKLRRPLAALEVSYESMQRTAQFGALKVGSTGAGTAGKFAAPSKGIRVSKPKYKETATDRFDPADATEFETFSQADEKRRADRRPGRRQVVESHEFP